MPLNSLNVPPEIFDYLPPIVIIDTAGTIVWTNSKKIKLPTLSPGKNILDAIPELALDNVFSKMTWNYVAIDGISYCISSSPFQERQGATLFFEPVESRTLSMIIENHYEGFICVDKNGIIRIINDTLANYLKVPKDKLVGQSFDKFKIDPELHRIIETQKPDLLSILSAWRNIVASRHPIFQDGEFIGVYARYFSIDSRDLKENIFGGGYINLLEGLQISNITQAMVELNAYKHEFLERHTTRSGIEKIIGNSPRMAELKRKILMVHNSPSSILLTGASGTGKEVFAQAIHFHSNRADHPFIKVNCAAIPDSLLEAELFGYVEGAFTGALKRGKMGKFELANKGIIFLDEIGDLPLAMQAKLLRVLQEKEIERLGAEKAIPIDVRVISATNKDLHTMAMEGTFRADLYYRLNVINFHIPSLKDRMSDIPELVDNLIRSLNKKLNRNIKSISPEAMHRLINYDWPGNIRELINVLETSMNFCQGDILDAKDLPYFFLSNIASNTEDDNLQFTIEHVKASEIVAALEKSQGKRKIAASLLGISKSTLYRLMKKYNLM